MVNPVRVWIKHHLARSTTVIEFCYDCGRRQPVVWTAPNDLWALVTDQPVDTDMGGLLCPDCFDRRSVELGLSLRWIPELEYVSPLSRPAK